MRFLIVGGTRFIGPYVVRGLAAANHEVTVFHRGDNEPDLPASVRHVHSPDAAMPVLHFPVELLKPASDVVIHMIPMGEHDTRAAISAFAGMARRMVCLSSGDVYRAYGRFTEVEPGPVEEGLLTEDSPLRSALYPYRARRGRIPIWHEKILVERLALDSANLPASILHLPKLYGLDSNADHWYAS